MLACLRAVTGNDDAAAEGLQEAFVAVARDPARLGRSSDLGAYLVGIARQRGLDLLRRQHRLRWVVLDDRAAPVPGPAPSATDPCETVAVQRALGELPSAQRDVLRLHLLDGMTFAETAAMLGIPTTTAADRYHAALKFLRQRLSAWGQSNV